MRVLAQFLRVLLRVLIGHFPQLPLPAEPILPLVYNPTLIYFTLNLIHKGEHPASQNPNLSILARMGFLEKYHILVHETAVVEQIDALFEGEGLGEDLGARGEGVFGVWGWGLWGFVLVPVIDRLGWFVLMAFLVRDASFWVGADV